jgi:hypothetical protein
MPTFAKAFVYLFSMTSFAQWEITSSAELMNGRMTTRQMSFPTPPLEACDARHHVAPGVDVHQ